MDHFEQINQFNIELDKLIERVRSEYDMSYEQLVGALFIRASSLARESDKEEFEDEDGE